MTVQIVCFAQIAIRRMLHDDNSMAVMLLFGCIGLLNAVCLAPVLLILHLAGSMRFAGLSARVLGLTVCKGAPPPGSNAPLDLKLSMTAEHTHLHCPMVGSQQLFACLQVSLTMCSRTICGHGR